MRTRSMLAVALALVPLALPIAAEAGPRGVPGGFNGPRPGAAHAYRPRWGGRIAGRWWAGMRAPGGWRAYRRPVRGWALPSYWVQPGWYVSDWASYGLPQPPYGYAWSRYYDDAVLIDGRGAVYDRVGGIGWDRVDPAGVDYTYYDQGDAPRIAYPGPDADGGLGGAVVGGVVGGIAGNLIAGPGNRLGGTLIGAGAGALVGQAIDKSDRAGRTWHAAPGAPYPAPRAVPAGAPPMVAYQSGSYGGDYAGTTYSGVTHYGPAPQQPAPAPRPLPYPPAPATVVTADGPVVTTTNTQAGGGYVAGGYYFPGATVTTVTVTHGGGSAYEEVYEAAPTYTKGRVRRYVRGGCNC